MRRNFRLMAAAAAVVVATVLGWASASWGCGPSAYLNPIAQSPVQPGQVVTVSGSQFTGRTELRWNATAGPILAVLGNGMLPWHRGRLSNGVKVANKSSTNAGRRVLPHATASTAN